MAKKSNLSDETIDSVPEIQTPEERAAAAAAAGPMPTPDASKFAKPKPEAEKKINRAGETKKPEVVYVIGSDDDPENRKELPVNAVFRDDNGKLWPAIITNKYLSRHEVPDATRESEWRAVRDPWYSARVNIFTKVAAGRYRNNWVFIRGLKLKDEVGDNGPRSKNRWLEPMKGCVLPDLNEVDSKELKAHNIREALVLANGGKQNEGVPQHNDELIKIMEQAGLSALL